MELIKTLKMDVILTAANLVEKMDPDDVKKIGSECIEGFNADETSRAEWYTRYQ